MGLLASCPDSSKISLDAGCCLPVLVNEGRFLHAAGEHLDPEGTRAAEGIEHMPAREVEPEGALHHGSQGFPHPIRRRACDRASLRRFEGMPLPYAADHSHARSTSSK